MGLPSRRAVAVAVVKDPDETAGSPEQQKRNEAIIVPKRRASLFGTNPPIVKLLGLLLFLGICERILNMMKRGKYEFHFETQTGGCPRRQKESSQSRHENTELAVGDGGGSEKQRPRFSALPSGWDEAAFQLYHKKKDELTGAVVSDPKRILSHRVLPLEAVRTVSDNLGNWFPVKLGQGKGPPNWEPETFGNFFKHLSSGSRYYVGFGTWIGPVLFYAAQLVDEAYGIEADPVAFARVETNAALNRASSWARRIHLSPHAIGLGAQDRNVTATNVKMVSEDAGNSGAGIGGRVAGTSQVSWMVNTYPLPYLLRRWNVPSTRELFVKVDVESFECQLVPSWVPWLESIQGAKPTFHIAFHSQIVSCSEEEYQSIYRFADLFDNKNKGCMDSSKKLWTCGSGEFVFHDCFF